VLIAAVLLLAVGVTVAFSSLSTREYAAEADLLVSPVPDEDGTLAGLGLITDPTTGVFTTARLLKRPEILDAVRKSLKLPLTRRELESKVVVTPIQQSNIVSIATKAASAKQSSRLANTFAAVLIDERTHVFQERLDAAIRRLTARRAAVVRDLPHPGTSGAASLRVSTSDIDRRLAFLRSFVGQKDPNLQVWSAAVPADGPVPKSPLAIVAAFVAALLLGVGAALAIDAFDPRVRGEGDLPSALPIMARVPRRRVDGYLEGTEELPDEMREAFRFLRASVAASVGGDEPYCVVVTSSVAREGKTVMAVGLATLMAASGRRVVLVDANLRNPCVARALRTAPPREGLLAVLRGDRDAGDAVMATGRPGLKILVPEAMSHDGDDLIERSRIEQFVGTLEGMADVVVIDTAGLTENAASVALVDSADVVLVAARVGRTREDKLEEVVDIIGRKGITPAGIVLTKGGRRWRDRGRQPADEPFVQRERKSGDVLSGKPHTRPSRVLGTVEPGPPPRPARDPERKRGVGSA
jgi:non-specific protein-tyrosine kinase